MRVVVAPEHIEETPLIALTDGDVATVTVRVATQPPEVVYVITEVPEVTPVTIPVEAPTVATEGELLDQLPPIVALASVVVLPVQTEAVPVIAATDPLV